jgi:hypothetical protein
MISFVKQIKFFKNITFYYLYKISKLPLNKTKKKLFFFKSTFKFLREIIKYNQENTPKKLMLRLIKKGITYLF